MRQIDILPAVKNETTVFWEVHFYPEDGGSRL
jgi:hypothetical protein